MAARWENSLGIIALSSIHVIDGKEQYHLSFSDQGERLPAGVMEAILRQWGALAFEEDNHVPNGKVRNFWWIVGRDLPQICPCKNEEEPHEEEGGYVWREDKRKSP
jgi:hypothetical protein